MDIILKDKALELNQKWYFTGIECQNGHIDKRYVNTGICYQCKRNQNIKCNKNNPDTLKRISKKTYEKNKANYMRLSREWAEKNPERRKEIVKKSALKNKEKNNKKSREYNKLKRQNDPYWRLSKNMSKAIWECLKNNKNQLSWLKFVDYTLSELISHLESKFDDKMNWENYGSYWHLDHIRPMSWFDLKTEFKECWALENLQPLEGTINYSKCNRYEG